MDFISNTSGLRMVVASWLDEAWRETDEDPLCVSIIPILAWAVDKEDFCHQAEPVVPPEYAEFLPRYEKGWTRSAYINASGAICEPGGICYERGGIWERHVSLKEWVEKSRQIGAAHEAGMILKRLSHVE